MNEIQETKINKIKIEGQLFSWLIDFVKIAAVFIAIFIVSFTILNFPAVFIQAKYFFKSITATKIMQANIDPIILYKTKISKDTLNIPKIDVNTPVHWNVLQNEDLVPLETGVAHFKGTAFPGNFGNVFIYGHSSYYWWNKGSYKEVFALLDKLKIGDHIYVNYNDKQYSYTVTDKKVVSPKNISVLTQDNTKKTLSLMTCTPVGTTLNRLIVTAAQD